MDFGKAVMFVTEDEEWMKKIGIGLVVILSSIILFGIPAMLVLGYQVAVTRNRMNGEDRLPEWDFGNMFMDGLYLFVARFVYSLPVSLIACLAFAGAIAGGVFTESASGDFSDIIGGITGIYFIAMFCLIFLFAIVLAFVSPAINIQYVRNNGDFGSLFRFSEVLGIARANAVDILLTFVVAFAGQFVIQTVGGILFFTICGPFIIGLGGAFWLSATMGHLYGQIAAKDGGVSKEKMLYE